MRIGPRLALGFGVVLTRSVVIVLIAYFRLNAAIADVDLAKDYDHRSDVMHAWQGKTAEEKDRIKQRNSVPARDTRDYSAR